MGRAAKCSELDSLLEALRRGESRSLVICGEAHTDLRLAVLTNALPAPVAAAIFAVQYKQGQREMASAVLFSSVFSIATLGAFIALT